MREREHGVIWCVDVGVSRSISPCGWMDVIGAFWAGGLVGVEEVFDCFVGEEPVEPIN